MSATSCDYLGLTEGALYYFKAPTIGKDQPDYLADSSLVYLYRQSKFDSYGKFTDTGEQFEVLDTAAALVKCGMKEADKVQFRCVKSRRIGGIGPQACPIRGFEKLKFSVIQGTEFAHNE